MEIETNLAYETRKTISAGLSFLERFLTCSLQKTFLNVIIRTSHPAGNLYKIIKNLWKSIL